jgi:hypothetical protein
LPTYSHEDRGRFERGPDRRRNDESFTAALQGLFKILNSWGDGASSIDVRIEDVYSPMDFEHRVSGDETQGPSSYHRLRAIPPSDTEQIRRRDLRERRYKYSFLNLLRPAALPDVPVINMFVINRNHIGRQISPQAVVEIATKLPNLVSLHLDVREPGERYPAMRRAHRDTFIRALESIRLPERLQRVFVRMSLISPLNQTCHPTNLVPTGANRDPLGRALRQVTVRHQRLKHLHIKGTIDPAFLWPGTLGPSSSLNVVKPFWQHLESLSVNFNLTTPSGQWYFRGRNGNNEYPHPVTTNALSDTQMPPGYGHSEQDDIAAALRFDSREDDRQSGTQPKNIFRVAAWYLTKYYLSLLLKHLPRLVCKYLV